MRRTPLSVYPLVRCMYLFQVKILLSQFLLLNNRGQPISIITAEVIIRFSQTPERETYQIGQ